MNYNEAFQRNIGVFTPEEQNKIKNLKVAIAGCGGMGGQAALQFVRIGVENFSVADFDVYNVVNINNQFNCNSETIGRNKASVVKEDLLKINPNAKVVAFEKGVKEENVEDFLKKADIVVDAIDYYNQKDSAVLHREAKKRGLYVFAPQAIGVGASLLVFDPEGVGIDEHLGQESIDSSIIPAEKFSAYIPTYADPSVVESVVKNSGEYLPNIASAQTLGVSMLVGEALHFVLKGVKPVCVPNFFHIDLWDKKLIT
jgi:molybdopterin/thiamine biosynthesis adenylyltransferase